MKYSLSLIAVIFAAPVASFGATVDVGSNVDGSFGPFNNSAVSEGNTNIKDGDGNSLFGDTSEGSGFIFALGRDGFAPQSYMFYTNDLSVVAPEDLEERRIPGWYTESSGSLAGVTIGDIASLGVFNRNGTNGANSPVSWLAVEAGGEWYAVGAGFQSSTNDWLPNSTTMTDFKGGIFESGVFVATDVAAPGAALDPSLEVTGFGVFSDTGSLGGGASRVRLDSYSVTLNDGSVFYQHFRNFPSGGDVITETYNWNVETSIPEASVLSLTAMGGIALLALLRRRK